MPAGWRVIGHSFQFMDNGARCTAGSRCPAGQGSRAIFRRWAAAFPYDELMRHDDLGGQQVGVLDVVDGLACRLNAKLIGIDVHGRQRRVGDAGEQRVVKGYDGQIFRDAQAQLAAELFQYHRKNVIADQNRCRAVRSGKQRFQGGFIGIIQGIDLHTVPFPRGDAVLEQRHLIAAFPLGRKQHGIADPKIGDAAVAQFIEVVGGFLSGKGVVVVDVDGLVGRLGRLAYDDMEQPLAAQIGSHRTIFFGVEQDESIGLRVGYHALDSIQHFGIVLAGDDGVYITALVAELPDAPDDLQMKGIFIYVPLGGRQDDADGLGKCFGRFSLKIWFIAHLRHDAADAFFCVPADGWAVLAGAGDRGRRNARSGRNIFDRDCHALNLLSDISIVKGFARKVNVCVLICVNCATVLLQRFDIFNKNRFRQCTRCRKTLCNSKNSCKICKNELFLLRNPMQM